MKHIISTLLLLGMALGSKGVEAAEAEKDAEVIQQKVYLKTGTVVQGDFQLQEGKWIQTQNGVETSIDTSQVDSVVTDTISKDEHTLGKAIGSTRYLYFPSAHMLKKGDITYSQKELFFSSVGFGLTDHVSLQLGTVLPALFVDGGGNLIAALKVGGEVATRVNLAGGVQSFIVDAGALNLPFATMTYGTEFHHLSFTYGKAFSSAGSGSVDLFNVSGATRITKRFGLLGEFTRASLPEIDSGSLLGLAGRIYGEKLYADVGLVFFEGSDMPFPWVDFSYDF